VVYVKVK